MEDGAIFESALAHVLDMEGGYSDDPHDPGGPTNRGITLRVYADWTGATLDATSHARLKRELQSIAVETVQSIYRARYWHPASCAELPPPLALMHFDAAVNHGVGTAIRFLQSALGVEADGEIGPMTRAALAKADVTATLEDYAELRRRRYRALPHFWRFGRGWLHRVEATRTAALKLAAAPSNSIPKHQPKGPSTMTQANDSNSSPATSGKWWGHSLTIWGSAVTAAAALLPALGPLIGLDITPETVRKLGGDIGTLVQLVTGLLGTVMTIYGRSRAAGPLVRRDMFLRL